MKQRSFTPAPIQVISSKRSTIIREKGKKLYQCFLSFFEEYVFPEPDGGRPQKYWEGTAVVECGWGKQYQWALPMDHHQPDKWPYPQTLPECKDPRGCPVPPLTTDLIWGSYNTSKTKSLEVGAMYYYVCKDGMFLLPNGTFIPHLELTCINEQSGYGAPNWSPPYDHENVPFPPCQVMCK